MCPHCNDTGLRWVGNDHLWPDADVCDHDQDPPPTLPEGAMKRITITIVLLLATALLLSACTSDADAGRRNLDTAAEQFEVPRRIVFINGITDSFLLEAVGFCSYESEASQVVIVCRNPDGSLLKHSMIRSDNVTAIIEQLVGVDADTFRPRIIIKPESLLPDFDVETRDEQEAEAEAQGDE